jgi:hypothetical protein
MAAKLSTRELCALARTAGYEVLEATQLRPNRWSLLLRNPAGTVLLVLAQARPLITAADVQDLADLVRLRPAVHGVLLAIGGAFSPAAQRTFAELANERLHLASSLPPAAGTPLPAGAALQTGR